RPTDRRRIAPAELRDEPVVAPAGADRALRSEPIRDPLEDRPRVVVEPADEARIDLERNAGIAQQPLETLEVVARPLVEILAHDRRAGDEFRHVRVLAVEDPQRIALEPPQAVRVQ